MAQDWIADAIAQEKEFFANADVEDIERALDVAGYRDYSDYQPSYLDLLFGYTEQSLALSAATRDICSDAGEGAFTELGEEEEQDRPVNDFSYCFAA